MNILLWDMDMDMVNVTSYPLLMVLVIYFDLFMYVAIMLNELASCYLFHCNRGSQ